MSKVQVTIINIVQMSRGKATKNYSTIQAQKTEVIKQSKQLLVATISTSQTAKFQTITPPKKDFSKLLIHFLENSKTDEIPLRYL